MGQFMAEEPLQIQNRNHQEAWEVQAGELEEVAVVEALAGELEQVALEEQVVQGEAVLAAAVVVVAAAVEEILWETLCETPTKAESMAVRMMMTTPRTIRTRSSS